LWNSEVVVRTVSQTLLTTGAVLIGVAAVAAQAPSPSPAVFIKEIQVGPFANSARSPAAVIERLRSFDVNADNRISADELPERMQSLVARGDKNADAALDLDEIRTLVNAAASERIRRSFRAQPSEGLAGVISDLKLPPAKHERALVIVGAHNQPPRHVNDPGRSALFAEMKALLDDEEYENFVAAATRLSRSADLRFRMVGGVVSGVVVQQAPR
jgi:hypothetical protein